jgi:hypothetical protein
MHVQVHVHRDRDRDIHTDTTHTHTTHRPQPQTARRAHHHDLLVALAVGDGEQIFGFDVYSLSFRPVVLPSPHAPLHIFIYLFFTKK